MKYWNSFDIFFDTKLDIYWEGIQPDLELHLASKEYSPDVEALNTIINCSRRSQNFKHRSRFSRKEKNLFFDIIIDYDHYMSLKEQDQKKCIALSFLKDMEILRKYKPKDFRFEEMKLDFALFFKRIQWLDTQLDEVPDTVPACR